MILFRTYKHASKIHSALIKILPAYHTLNRLCCKLLTAKFDIKINGQNGAPVHGYKPGMSFPFVSRLINATAASQLAIIDALLSTLCFTRLGLQEMKKSVARRRMALFSFRLHVVIQQISYRTSPSTRAATLRRSQKQ